jgi:hypothetical protein
MAGFEVIVRPVVFPNIRPAPPRSLPPEDDPTKGIAVLGGSGGGVVSLSYSYSMSMDRSKQHLQEEERTVDVARVYQKETDENGKETVNQENYLDVEGPFKVLLRDPVGGRSWRNYQRMVEATNIQILQRDLKRKNPDYRLIETDTRLPVDDR